jgi:AraC-like DNA-binding protein
MKVTVAATKPARLNATAAARAASAPRLQVGDRGARYEGPLLGVGRHASGVTCFVEALEGTVRVGRLRAKAIRIPAGVLHEVHASPGARVMFWYVEPGGPPERFVREVSLREVRALTLDVAVTAADRRVRRVLDELRADLGATPGELAARVGLSGSRLRHLLREHLGVPLVRLRWWFQMRRAARVIERGGDLSRAAHEAGFSDSAHFTRTFRRMFGFAPSRLLGARVRLEVSSLHGGQ